jgi:hypothetical protein
MFDPDYEEPVEDELRAAVERALAEFEAAAPENQDGRKQHLLEALHVFHRYISRKPERAKASLRS